MGRSVPSHLHSVKILCTHGNVTHGDFIGASGTVRTQPAALNVGSGFFFDQEFGNKRPEESCCVL